MNEMCRICERPMKEHDSDQGDECWAEVEARGSRKDISSELLGLRAITQETLKQNYWTCDRDKLKQKPVIVNTFFDCESLDTSMFFWGKFGTGKTYQARCILNEAMKRGWRVIDIGAIRLAKMLRHQYNQDQLVEYCKQFSVVLIDDIDKAVWGPREVEGLWDILNTRADRKLKTIITSNVHPKEFADMIAAGAGGNQTIAHSMWQRLMPCLVLEFTGESLR